MNKLVLITAQQLSVGQEFLYNSEKWLALSVQHKKNKTHITCRLAEHPTYPTTKITLLCADQLFVERNEQSIKYYHDSVNVHIEMVLTELKKLIEILELANTHENYAIVLEKQKILYDTFNKILIENQL